MHPRFQCPVLSALMRPALPVFILIQQAVLERMQKTPAKQATVPKGTPARKSWHVERRGVMDTVFNALTAGTGPRVVGLVGHSGSGKTTAASEIVRSTEVREAFSDGIVWLTVNKDAKDRLSSVMQQLARMVYEDIGDRVGSAPREADDGAAYVKQRMMRGPRGRGLKCLVVADNVWEREIVSKLRETGMWVILSTRLEGLVVDAEGEPVGVDELSKADAASVLRRAAELSPDVRLPDDAVDLIELCGHVAMDLAFVGRWSTVRGREDRTAWSGAAENVRAAIGKIGDTTASETAEGARTKRRKAILQAGFEDLAIGSDDERVQRLYLSLAVLPDGHAFTARDTAALLYDRTPSVVDDASAGDVVGVLERWSVIGSVGKAYRMHDAHSSFARECIMDRGNVRRPAVKRWVKYISTLEYLRSIDPRVLKGLWQAVEDMGGDGWSRIRPYERTLADMDETDPSLQESIEALAYFQEAQEDFEGASTMWHRLLEVEKRELGADHPFVLNSYRSLADCAERLGNPDKAAEWRGMELTGLPLAVAKVQQQLGDGVEGFGNVGLPSIALSMLRLTPDDRDTAEMLSRRWLGIQEDKLGSCDLEVAITLCYLGLCVWQGGRLNEAEELLRRCLKIREDKLGPEHCQVANTLYQLGICVRMAGRLEEAEKLLRRCLVIEEANLGPVDVQVAYALLELGVCVREAGRLEEAEELLRRCLRIKEANLEREDVGVSSALHELGACVRDAGRLEEAEELLRRCLWITETKLGPEDMQVATTLYSLGRCARKAGRLVEAEEFLRRCLCIKEAKFGPEDLRVSSILHQLGVCIREAGRLEESEKLLRRCLRIKESKLGVEHVGLSYTLSQLGACVRETGRLKEAEELWRRCLGIQEDKLGTEELQVAFTLHQLGACVREAGQLEEAEELLRRCLGIQEDKIGPEDMQVAYTLHHLGACVREVGRLEEAEELLRRCLRIQEAKLGPGDVRLTYTAYQLGVWVCEAGRLEEAEELLRRRLGIKEAKLGLEDEQVAATLHQLVVCAREAGRLGEAEELLRHYLRLRVAEVGQDCILIASTLRPLGVCVYEAGRLEEAEKLFRRCLRIQEDKNSPEDVQVASTLHQLGMCVREAGRPEEAEALLRSCLRIYEVKLGRESIGVASTLLSLGICLHKAGRSEEAGELWGRCRTIGKAKPCLKNVLVADAFNRLGVLVGEAGRLGEVENLFRRCLAFQLREE